MPANVPKGCNVKVLKIRILMFASLFVFTFSCGIPTYLSIDDSYIVWNSPQQVKSTLECSVAFTSEALLEIDEKITIGPALKFFYILSMEAADTSKINGSITVNGTKPNVSSLFNTYLAKKTSGNGDIWVPDLDKINTAPGFYLYNNTAGTAVLSRTIPANDEMHSDNPSGILVGTFATSPVNTDDFLFRGMHEMDVLINPVGDVFNFSFSLKAGSDENHTVIEMVSGSESLDMKDYASHEFPLNLSTLKEDTLSVDSDAEFVEYLQQAGTLYVHVYASIFGGEGAFNNIFWSSLQYLGSMMLYSEN